MHKLRLDTFLSGSTDPETRQYHVLEGLKRHYAEFSHNRLYPSLAELVALHAALTNILNSMTDIQGHLPHDLKEVDLEEGKLVYNTGGTTNDEFVGAAELIAWALPRIKQAIEEGISIYNFVEERIKIDHVGILPMYREEGYWFVPENRAALLHLLRYELSLFTAASERFRSLKTTNIGEVEQKFLLQSPESIKLRLIEQYRDMPNPATFVCETDLDFPYAETILPIAKRKLMAQVFS
jgi:hypothetical protein